MGISGLADHLASDLGPGCSETSSRALMSLAPARALDQLVSKCEDDELGPGSHPGCGQDATHVVLDHLSLQAELFSYFLVSHAITDADEYLALPLG